MLDHTSNWISEELLAKSKAKETCFESQSVLKKLLAHLKIVDLVSCGPLYVGQWRRT